MNKKHYLSEGQKKEREERLLQLQTVLIPQNSEDLRNAAAQGDLSENAEYENAKEEQAKLAQEVVKIQNILANAVIITESESNEQVEVGHKVTIKNLDSHITTEVPKEETVVLMGYGDGETAISIDSPLGQAILGKKVGDTVTVELPNNKELTYQILAIG